jgi:hypothetical protein
MVKSDGGEPDARIDLRAALTNRLLGEFEGLVRIAPDFDADDESIADVFDGTRDERSHRDPAQTLPG